MLSGEKNGKKTCCNHFFKPLNYLELKPEIYLVRWKCKRCGKIYTFKTSTNWQNMEEIQGGRSFYNNQSK